jgi:hypothetical protein
MELDAAARDRLPPSINIQVEHFKARRSRKAHARASTIGLSLHFKLRRGRRSLRRGFARSLRRPQSACATLYRTTRASIQRMDIFPESPVACLAFPIPYGQY